MINNKDIPDILQWADSVQTNYNPTNDDLLDIYEGNLKEHLDASLQAEFSAKAFEAAKRRTIPINVLKRTTDKLAKVYSQGVTRTDSNPTNQELIDLYEECTQLNVHMSKADSLFNLLRSVAFEPYLHNGKPQIRVLTSNKFTVWSNDRMDDTNPTVFIKFMGTKTKDSVVEDQELTRQVNLYVLYDKDEFIKIDSDGDIEQRKRHNFGRIPFTYMNMSVSHLVPKPDEDSLQTTIVIPTLLSDLNYASKYLSHGVRYGIDVDVVNLEGNPDSFLEVATKDRENAKPQIGVIAPSVNIPQVITLAKEELVMYLESRSLKVGSVGQFENSASGFAKLIDSADVTDVRKENMFQFKAAELDLLELISIKHNAWVAGGQITNRELLKSFTSDFDPSVVYGDMAPIVDPQEKRDNLEFKLKNKLTTRERAIREANPELSKEEQDKLIEELNGEQTNTSNEIDRGAGANVQDPEGE